MEDNQNGFLKGVLCGAVLMLLCGTIGINVYKTFLVDQYRISMKKETEQVAETEAQTETELSLDLQTVNKKIEKLEKMINQYYLDDIDKDTVEADLYKGLIAGLGDPYAAYYTEAETKKLKESNTGEYYGIGAKMMANPSTGAITIVSCFEGTPAEKAGLVPQDILYTVNGTKVTGMELTDVVKLIKNSGDSKVHLQVLREGETDYLEFDVELTDVETPTVIYEMLANQIGYIKITEFNTATVAQFQAALDGLNEQGMEKLVIDLRNNLGGVLTSCVAMLNQMLPEGIIVYTVDKEGNRTDYTCDGKHEFTKPLAVLVNGYSASASEIFTGAVKDYGIGTIVGTTTYGKGIVQGIYDLGDGTSLKLTKAKYYTPSGICIHKTGIEPDVEIDLMDELKTKAVITKEEDNQLQKALEILN